MNDEADAPGGAYREIIREQEERIDRLVFKLSQAQELITELCDALVYLEMTKHQQLEYHNNTDLIHRAREATTRG